MKKIIVCIVLIALAALAGCGYMVVEQRESLPDWMTSFIERLDGVAYAEAVPNAAPVQANPIGREPAPAIQIPEVPPFEPIVNGASGADVKAIQSRLIELGFMTDRADGFFGPKTEAAVKSVQQYLYDREQAALAPETDEADDPAGLDDPAELDESAPQTQTILDESDEDELPPEDSTIDVIDGEEDEEVGEDEDGALAFSGVVDEALHSLLLAHPSAWVFETLQNGSKSAEVLRLQTRLGDLNYLYKGIDGIFGSKTGAAVKAFQKQNKLDQTGIADHATQAQLFSAEAKKSPKPALPYVLKIDVSKQKVYAYSWNDVDGEYTTLVRTMTCSTGLKATPTPTGTFSSKGPVARWGYFPKWNVYAQYLTRINGPYLFHSVLYRTADEKTLIKNSEKNLGKRASHGCVRLSVADAKWIYTNCPKGTKIVIS